MQQPAGVQAAKLAGQVVEMVRRRADVRAAETSAAGPNRVMCELQEKARRRCCVATAEKANRAPATRKHGPIS